MLSSTIAVLPLALLASAQTDLAVGMRADTAIGSASRVLGPDGHNEPTVMAQAAPAAGLRMMDARTTVVLRYFPRLYLRYPNLADAARPLLFHWVGLSATHLLSPRVTWSLLSTAGQGEMDYSSSLVAASGQTAQANPPNIATGTPQTTQTSQTAATSAAQRLSVLRLRTLAASTTMGWQESQRANMSLDLFTSGTAAAPGGLPLPNGTVWIVGSDMTQEFLVAPQDGTGLTLSYQHGYVESAPQFDNASATWNWAHQYSATTQAALYAGFGVMRSYGRPLSGWPVAWITLQSTGFTERGFRRSLMLSSGVRTFVNTLVGTATPMAFVQGSAIYDLESRWWFDALVGFQMPVSKGTTIDNSQLIMSLGNGQLALHRRVGQNFVVDFGVRGYLFADSPVVSNPQILGTQIWAYVGFTWSESTRNDDAGAWVL